MKIEYLETFILLSEVKSFSKLALDLGISQSTLSHRITELEKEFGQIRFINRTTRKFELTEEGQIFLEYAKKIVNLYKECKTELSELSGIVGEDIIISASTLPGSHILPKYIARFRKNHPNANFKIFINNSRKSLKLISEKQVDFAGIGSFMGYKKENFDIIKIGEDQLKFICSPNHDLIINGKKIISFQDILKYPFIIREKGSGTRNIFEQQFSEYNKLNIELEMDDNDSIISAVSESNYISVLSEFIAKKAENAGLIKQLEIKEYPIIAKRDIYFIKPKNKKISKLKKDFWKSLIKIYNSY
ncbi:MAG: LysR substrate-binding domain-containing protein [Promethearchaeota archaeon]